MNTPYRKKYIANIIGDEYEEWGRRKIFLNAPTGTGKTTFLVKKLLAYHRMRGKKVLILCNRKLLRKQYLGQLTQEFDSYAEFNDAVEVKTYQELANILASGADPLKLFNQYEAVFMDECHYFYSDSDFNGIGTYVLLHAIIYAGMLCQLVFISATMDCVQDLIVQVIKNCAVKYPQELRRGIDFEKVCQILSYDFDYLARYDYIRCKYIPDYESLCSLIGTTEKKSVVFIDNKKKAQEIVQYLFDNNLATKTDIALLNAQNLDEEKNHNIVEKLTIANKLISKILITTSVLDNGVSIHDNDVENICILTESKVSFMQMIGRIRTENTKKLNLLFVRREASYFERRANECKRLMDYFPKNYNENFPSEEFQIMNAVWNNQEEISEIYRMVYVPVPRRVKIFEKPKSRIRGTFGGNTIVVNNFSKRKVEDLYLMESRLYQLAVVDPMNVIYEQMSWINKKPTDLEIVSSCYMEELTEELLSDLLEINEFDKTEISRAKKAIAQKYNKDILKNYSLRNRSFSNEKLEKILNDFNLELITVEEHGRKLYTVKKKEEAK